MIPPKLYEMAVNIVAKEARRDNLKQCRERIEEMADSSDSTTSAIGVLALVTLATLVNVVSDEEG